MRKWFALLLAAAALAMGLCSCGDEGAGAPPQNLTARSLLREVCYYEREVGARESKNALVRRVVLTLEEDGAILRESFDGEGERTGRARLSPEGYLLFEETFLREEDGAHTTALRFERDARGNATREETSRDGQTETVTLREYDERDNVTFEQILAVPEGGSSGDAVVQITHRYENSYDEAGRLLEQVYTCDEEPFQNMTTRYAYDSEGRVLLEEKEQEGKIVSSTSYTRDERGEVTRERSSANGVASERQYALSYDSSGRVIRREETSADPPAATAYVYDEEGRCTRSTNLSGGERISEQRFVYEDAGGRPTRVEQTSLRYEGGSETGEVYTTVYRYEGEADEAAARAVAAAGEE